MHAPTEARRYSIRKAGPHDSEPNPIEPIPFGRGGVGRLTAHPVGLVVVFGVVLMALFGLAEARWFLAGTLLLGGLWGFFLWLRHR
jgi:hypothetical protein